MAKENKRKPKMTQRRGNGNAFILKTDETKYSDVLKAMRTDISLNDLGAAVPQS